MYKGAEVFGVMNQDNFKQMTIDIAAGRYKPSQDEPKKWFASFSGLAEYAKERAQKSQKIPAKV